MEEPDPYTFYCDVYSFGVVIFELITSQLPYPHVQERDQVTSCVYSPQAHAHRSTYTHAYFIVHCSLYADLVYGGVWFSKA